MKPSDILLATIGGRLGLSLCRHPSGATLVPALYVFGIASHSDGLPLVFFCPRPDVSWTINFGTGMVLRLCGFPLFCKLLALVVVHNGVGYFRSARFTNL